MQTHENERREFVRRLRSDPLFLSRHTGTLGLAVYRKLANRLTLSFAAVHRGRKIWPEWLADRELPAAQAPGGIAQRLPQRPNTPCSIGLGELPDSQIPPAAHGDVGEGSDPEDYLADNRWGFLLQSLLERRVDWEGAIARCARWAETHADRTDRAWEPYSTCERIANLTTFLAAMPRSLRSAAALTRLESFIEASLQWVYRHLEYYGPAETNNHILNNARALTMGGAVIGSAAAVSAGVTVLRRCLPEMIMEEGFLRERSSHYQLVVLNWLLDAWRFVALQLGEDGAEGQFLRRYVERMVAASAMLCDRNARLVALIGDVSPDATPEQSSARLRLLYPEFWPAVPAVVTPCQVSDGWFRVAAGKALVLGNFPPGDYPAAFPTHGHCDATSFVWQHDGQDILVDPGRYRYTEDAVSRFQQSAPAHNLPLIDGFAPLCESVISPGQWWPLPYARARLEIEQCSDGIVLRHDGFARSTPVRSHRRQIRLTESALFVTDSFEGQGSAWLELCWHFAEDFHPVVGHRWWLSGGQREVRMSVHGAPTPPVEDAQPRGWVSRAYGERRPAPAARLGWQVVLPIEITTQFQLIAGQESHSRR